MTYPTWFLEAYVSFEGKPLILEPFQVSYLNDHSTFRICNKCRQTGGSMQVAMDKFFRAYMNPSYRCDIVSINLKEATDKIKYIRNFWDSLPASLQIPLTTNNALSIGFHKGSKASIVNSLAASAGIRGGKKEVFFDEFAHIVQAEELFHAAAPAIMNGDLNLDIVSTPLGDQNLFARIFRNEIDPVTGRRPFDLFSRHQFIWLDVKRFVTDYEGAQHRWYVEYGQDMSRMEEMVAEFGNDRIQFFYHMYPWDQFTQEFCGTFNSDVNSFFSWELIKKALRGSLGSADDEREEYLVPWTERPVGNENAVYVGIDWAEGKPTGDETSIQVFERTQDNKLLQRASYVLRGSEFRENLTAQVERAAEICRAFRPTAVSVDHTGLGIKLGEDMRRALPQYAVELVDFTHQSKSEMALNVKSLLEHGNMWLQAEDRALHGQIHGIKREIGKTGITRYYGEGHDDMFWAMALAVRSGGFKPFTIYQIGSGRPRLEV